MAPAVPSQATSSTPRSMTARTSLTHSASSSQGSFFFFFITVWSRPTLGLREDQQREAAFPPKVPGPIRSHLPDAQHRLHQGWRRHQAGQHLPCQALPRIPAAGSSYSTLPWPATEVKYRGRTVAVVKSSQLSSQPSLLRYYSVENRSRSLHFSTLILILYFHQ